MIEKLFPKQLDNNYNGSLIAKYIFIFLTVVTIGRSLVHMFAPDGGAHSIATIPLDSFTQAGSDAVVFLFALWGLSQLLLGLFYLVVLWRYQKLIPLMYLMLIIEYTMRIVIGIIKPIVLEGTAPGGVGNYIIVPLAIIMLVLSLKNRKELEQHKS